MPITVEPSKLRMCHDERFLNLWIKDLPLSLDYVSNLSRYVFHGHFQSVFDDNSGYSLQASSLGGGGAKEGKMEREFATTSQEFEYLHRKFRCKMLIGGLVMTSSVFTRRRQNKRRMRRIKQRI